MKQKPVQGASSQQKAKWRRLRSQLKKKQGVGNYNYGVSNSMQNRAK